MFAFTSRTFPEGFRVRGSQGGDCPPIYRNRWWAMPILPLTRLTPQPKKDSGFQIPDSRFRIPDSRFSDSGFRIPDSRFSDSRIVLFWNLEFGIWNSLTGKM